MRVGYVCTDRGIPVPGDGSASIHVVEFTAALARLGHEVVVFRAQGSGPVPGAHASVKVSPENGSIALREHLRANAHPVLAKEVWSLSLNPATVRAIKRQHERQPFDGMIERLSLWSAGAAAACRELGIPYVLEVNSPILWEQRAYRDMGLERLAGALHDFTARSAGAIFTVSEALADHYREMGIAAPVRTVPNGVDLERFQPGLRSSRRPAWAHGFRIGLVGTMKPFHDLDTVAAAAERLPRGVRVIAVGTGPGRPALEAAPAVEMGKLVLPGAVTREEVPGLLGWFDAGLVPATPGHPYLSPLKLPEYLAAGLPVIVAEGTQADLMVGPEAKETYVSGDARSLLRAVARLRSRDLASMRLAARATAEGRSWDAVAATVAESLEGLRRREPAPVTSEPPALPEIEPEPTPELELVAALP
jgi:glycosyltransferase involved in cell wall biosynthesis